MEYAWNGAWGYLKFPPRFNFDKNDALDIGLYYIHGRWYNQDTGMWLSPDENGEYLYGSGQDAVNQVWAQFVAGATYQVIRNNADAVAIILFVSPQYRALYEQTFTGIEGVLPDTFPTQFGRLFGTTVTIVQGFGEMTILGPGIIGGGSATTCIVTVGGGCIPGVVVSSAAGGAVIVHGLSVEAASLRNGWQQVIAFAKKMGSGGPYKSTWRPQGGNWTQNEQIAKRKFGLTDREFNRAIHDIKQHIPGNPDVWFDLQTGNVHDPRSGEWIGNLLDYSYK